MFGRSTVDLVCSTDALNFPHTPSVYQDLAARTTGSRWATGQKYSTSVTEQTGVHSQNVTLRAVPMHEFCFHTVLVSGIS